MVFDSISYALFFITVFVLYWSLPSRFRTWLLLISSILFYSFNGLKFLPLLLLSTVIDFWSSRQISLKKNPRFWLSFSIFGNLSLLGLYKYSSFIMMNVNWLLKSIGTDFQFPVPHLDFPVGISFYTFQTMSYTIDVYRQRIAHEQSVPRYGLFVSYFPQLVAGPLERAEHLMPQLANPIFKHEGVPAAILLITWGLFKKTIVADRLHWVIRDVFQAPEGMYSGVHHLFVTMMIPLRFYCDFSGYCDIALGSAALLGVQLSLNFDAPFWSANVSEFWRRWHITLYLWFRDYVYTLFAKVDGTFTQIRKIMGIMAIFLLSGLWHGPSWTFIIWGFLNGLMIIGLSISQKWRKKIASLTGLSHLPESVTWIISVILTNIFISFATIFFQAKEMTQAMTFLSHGIQNSFLPADGKFFSHFHQYRDEALIAFFAVIFIQFIDLAHRKKFKFAQVNAWSPKYLWMSAWVLATVVFLFGYEYKTPFSYYYH